MRQLMECGVELMVSGSLVVNMRGTNLAMTPHPVWL